MVVNGRASIWGDAMMGLVEQSGLCEWWKDEYDAKLGGGTQIFTCKRNGRPDPISRTFSVDDAKEAKLWGKAGPWTQYSKRMLFHRARSWALRDAFPDVLKGLRYVEEERDIIDMGVTTRSDGEREAVPVPRRASQVASEPEKPTETAEATAPTEPTKTVFEALGDKVKKDKKLGVYQLVNADEPEVVYTTPIEEVAKYISETIKAEQEVVVEWEPGIGTRDILRVMRAGAEGDIENDGQE